MSGIPRMPRDSDPRKPRTQPDQSRELSGNPPRSYGQAADMSDRKLEEMEEFEDLTDEVVREGDDEPSQGDSPSKRKRDRKLREFEDLAGEPVFDEGDDDKSS